MSSLTNSPPRGVEGEPGPGSSAPSAVPLPWRQISVITLAAIALFVGFRYLPTGTNLSHMDFRATGSNVIETCDPSNPQFIPVVAVRSPVVMTLAQTTPAVAGTEVQATISLRTASGKVIAPEDLAVMHTRKLHLLISDPSLTDYQHVHPEPTHVPGEWAFHFTPKSAGTYRLFADFTPVATNRALYANTDLMVAASGSIADSFNALQAHTAAQANAFVAELGDYRFSLKVDKLPVRVREMADLTFVVARRDGGKVPMEPVMGAYAHLVAFDEARTGFAHLHPTEVSLVPPPDAAQPTLHFKITIPSPGRYVIWSQVNLGGRELFAPFWFEVVP